MTEDQEPNPWAAIIGPCYTTQSIARALGWTEEETVEAAGALTLLSLDTSDGVMLYAAFQLHDGAPVAGLTAVLRALQTGTASRWTWAQWLNTAYPNGEPTAIEMLIAGRLEHVLIEARHDAWAWTS